MRVRFAPSPTGTLHLGNARTAIVNWLHARSVGGTLVLRIEDTDRQRNTHEAEAGLIEDLAWLGVRWQEGPDLGGPHGPYRQSERDDRYTEIVDRLRAAGRAYPCFCAPDDLRRQRDAAREAGRDDHYPGTCRALAAAEAERRVASGEPAALRLRVDTAAGWPAVTDTLRGTVESGESRAEDFVIARADGSPLYQLAVVVDDHDMRIDHVIRGQDHLSNTARQLLLYRALGWPEPRFTHLPLVLGEDRGRLSKRHGATSVAEMRASGIQPEALLNYLALLGWEPPGGREVLSPDELAAVWRLDQMSSTNVAFDLDKLRWLDHQHILALPPAQLLDRARPWLQSAGFEPARDPVQRSWWERAVDLVRGQAGHIDGFASELEPIFRPRWAEPVAEAAERGLLDSLARAAASGRLDSPDGFKQAAREAGKEAGLKGRALFHPIRVALTGRDSGPELARLAPLIQQGAALDSRPAIPDVPTRIARALAVT